MQGQLDPIKKFGALFETVLRDGPPEASACVLATATADGRPSARVVLLKGFDEQGYVVYTNLESQKAVELRQNPQAALCFYWQQLKKQVRVEGSVQPVSPTEADAYFATRPRGSQIGAWASQQSEHLPERKTLETKFEETSRRFGSEQVSRPEFWSGFRLVPERIEFWSNRDDRLHDRELFIKTEAGWQKSLLYP